MHYEDPMFGPAEIAEPVLLDLLETKALQRLHGILQHGISSLVGVTSPITHLDHSMGAMLLVRFVWDEVNILHDVPQEAG
jgi:HD superfamily phosphohydrolase